jgi:hypothetical protein
MIHMNNSNAFSRSSASWTNGSFCAPTHSKITQEMTRPCGRFSAEATLARCFDTDRSIHWLHDDVTEKVHPSLKWPRNAACCLYSLKKNERYGSDGVYIVVIERWHLAPIRGEIGRKIEKQCMTDLQR